MGRLGSLLRGSVLARACIVVLAVVAGLAIARAGSGHAGDRPAERKGERTERAGVVDLTEERWPSSRPPVEEVSEDELASIERKIKARTAEGPEEGISPGAPTDEEVRRDLRELERAQKELPAGPIRRGSGDLIWPINAQFTSPFGQRWGRLHAGIDLAAPTGTPIRAAASGQVILMARTGGYGNYTCINHGSSFSTCYAHQSRFRTAEGHVVRQGEVIGYVGNTGHSFGPHLHFEVRFDGRPVDPMDYL